MIVSSPTDYKHFQTFTMRSVTHCAIRTVSDQTPPPLRWPGARADSEPCIDGLRLRGVDVEPVVDDTSEYHDVTGFSTMGDLSVDIHEIDDGFAVKVL